MTFKTVVVGIDGRDGGHDALALAAALLEPGGRLILATVIRPHRGERLSALLADADRQRAARMLETERAGLGVPTSTVVTVRSSVAEGLHSVVARYDADLLVVGSAHRGPVGRVLLGDDARRALNGAHCAVAVAPHGGENPPVWRTIAVGDDGSRESEFALATARSLAARAQATVRDCAVVGPASLGYRELSAMDLSESLARHIGEEEARLQARRGVQVDVLEGEVGEALAGLGHDVDLLVIGSRGLGPWGRLATGSTAGYLVRHGTCPLLILPRGLDPAAAAAPGAPSPDPHEPAVAVPEPQRRAR